MTVTTPAAAPSIPSTTVAAQVTPGRKAHRKKPAAVRYHRPAATFTNCDPNISAKIGTTTCPFAENAFYEYYVSGQAPSITVYSPAAGSSLDATCTVGQGMVACTTNDGGVVKFSQTSIDRYTPAEAASYSSSHNLGLSSGTSNSTGSASGSGSGSGGYTSGSNFCATNNCIPNYSNGNGYTVQCADGTYSQSGGIQGACSHHGGVG